MASAKGGSVPSGVGYGEGCPLSSRLKGLGELSWAPPAGSGAEPRPKTDFGVLKATERSFLYLYDKIWGGHFALASPAPNSGDLSPFPPVIYADVCGQWRTY